MRDRGLSYICAFAAIIALAACDQAKAPDNAAAVRSVTPVDSEPPAALEGEPDEPVGTYANRKYGFSVMIPEGWAQLTAAANEDGSIFEDKAAGADLRAYGADNEGDTDFQQAIEALRDGTTDVEGALVGDREYRGAATAEGDRIRIRLIKTASGAMASVMVRYPTNRAATLDPVAVRVLDSLSVTP
jgi:hypothetical protein